MSDDNINSLVQQLKDSTVAMNNVNSSNKGEEVTEENLEKFILKNSGELINQSLDVMRNVKDYVVASNDPEHIAALAQLINASTGAIEGLNKISLQNKKIEAAYKLKTMDTEAKKEITNINANAMLVGTREEIFKKILDDAKVIDANVINVPGNNVESSSQ